MMKPDRSSYEATFREYPDLLTVNELSQMLHISLKTAYRLLQEGKIQHFRIRSSYKIPKVSIIDYCLSVTDFH